MKVKSQINLPFKIGGYVYYYNIFTRKPSRAKIQEIKVTIYKLGDTRTCIDVYLYDKKNARELTFDYKKGMSFDADGNVFRTFLEKADLIKYIRSLHEVE